MRLIDADEALELIRVEYKNTQMLIKQGETELDNISEGFTEAAHIIQYLVPAVDAVPVVRCENCKHFLPPTKNKFTACSYPECGGMIAPNPNDFCSYGERKLKED